MGRLGSAIDSGSRAVGAVSERRFLLGLFVLALSCRMAATLLLRDLQAGADLSSFGADAVEFEELAWALASRGEFAFEPGDPTSFRAVGYPAVLAIVYSIVGRSFVAAYVLQWFIGAAAAVVGYRFLREAGVPLVSARLAGLLTAAYFGAVYLATNYTSEPLFILLTGLSGLLACKRGVGAAGASGAALGLATLVRPQGLFLLPALWVLVTTVRGDRRASLWSPAVATLALVLTLAPWIVRNHQVHDRFVLVATNGGGTFYGSNNDVVLEEPRWRGYWVPTNRLPDRELVDAAPSEAAADQVEYELGTNWIEENPGSFLELLPWKLANLVLPWEKGSANAMYRVSAAVFVTPWIALWLLGIALAVRRWRRRVWLAVLIATGGIVLLTLIFFGSARFRDGYTAWLALPVALALARCLAALGSRRASEEFARMARRPE